jgi:uncharacterized oxidoreductase
MPIFTAEQLKQFGRDIFKASGASEEEATLVMEALVSANLAGHDSHGVIRISQYVQAIRKGQLIPGAKFEIVRQTPSTALVNGNWGFGMVIARKAMELAIEKARTHKISAIGVFNSNHVGRLGDYCLMAAQQDLIGICMVNACGKAQNVAPFGGRAPRLATNPIAIAVPSKGEIPLVLDIATSTVSQGKIRVKVNRKEPVPQGWLIDPEGNPSTDPEVLYKTPPGALLPLGGSVGYKGFGLAFMIEIFSGILTTAGYSREDARRLGNGTFLIVIDVENFVPISIFKDQVADLIRYIKTCPPMPGFEEVLVPGEPELKETQRRQKEGIFVEEETWNQILTIARELQVPVPFQT